jgi:glyoxylase-like metal-dependent hydrolase (beta-lactamase superfamily II)
LQPDGGWGWSNSGLVTGGGASLLVDTLFDLVTTRQMLDGIRSLTDRAPLTTVVNTHSDGDHCFGNELVASPGVDMIAYTSRGTELRPGDVIGSGTVPTGCLFEDYATHPESFRGWLQPGDEVHLAIEQLGDIRQRIIAGSKPIPLSTGF